MDDASSDIRASIVFSGKSEEFVSIGNDLDWQKRMGREKILKTAGSETKIRKGKPLKPPGMHSTRMSIKEIRAKMKCQSYERGFGKVFF